MRNQRRADVARLAQAARAAADHPPGPDPPPVVLALPFRGTWLARNSPARRVPSHGTHLFGQSFAIDFVAVDQRRRSAGRRDWRTLVGVEPAERFLAFGQPILAAGDGRAVAVHDGEPDRPARRSPLTLLPYLLTQGSRLRRGLGAVAGNHVIVMLRDRAAYVAVAHLRAGSIRVRPGDLVTAGQRLAECGNSGNSIQPHVHVQVMDSADPVAARGIPMLFRDYRVRRPGSAEPRDVRLGIPDARETVEPVAAPPPQPSNG